MNKSKVLLVVAVALLLLACCSAAGCIVININGQGNSEQSTPIIKTSNDPIIGMWKTVNFDGGYTEVIDTFNADGTYTCLFLFSDGTQEKGDETHYWYNIGNNTYGIDGTDASDSGFILDPEENTLTEYYWYENYFTKEKENHPILFKRIT